MSYWYQVNAHFWFMRIADVNVLSFSKQFQFLCTICNVPTAQDPAFQPLDPNSWLVGHVYSRYTRRYQMIDPIDYLGNEPTWPGSF